MKKLITLPLVALLGLSAFAQGGKGEMTIDLGVGYGSMGTAGKAMTSGRHTMFTQRLGAEWVVIPEMINGKFDLAAGFYINNAYGTRKDGVSGTFDYSYTATTKWPWDKRATTTTYKRKGEGTATLNAKRDDLNFLPTVSFRFNVTRKFQVYASVGFGVGMIHTFDESYDNADGFKSNSSSGNVTYSYNDLSHAKWSMDTGTKVCFSYASYVGVRYFFSDKFGVNAQTGLLSSNNYSDWGGSESYVSVGVSCRF